MTAETAWSIDALAAAFRRFSEIDARGSSPLYEELAASIAEAGAILEIAASVRADQVVPYAFFGAVQYLLLADRSQSLARYYPGLADDPLPPEEAFPVFQTFCLDNADALSAIVSTRRVQTNEVARSTMVLPCLAYVAQMSGDKPPGLGRSGCERRPQPLP